MKNKLLTLLPLLVIAGCNAQHLTRKETVASYYSARNDGNYNILKTTVNDSITLTAGDFIMPYDRDSFYVQFQWDSVFKPSYKVIELEEWNDEITATIAQQNLRNAFLKNNPLVFKVNITFTADKISSIKELEYIDVDWMSWAEERDALVQWIAINHPELDGFVNDMTKNGALNYLKAIALYEGNEKR